METEILKEIGATGQEDLGIVLQTLRVYHDTMRAMGRMAIQRNSQTIGSYSQMTYGIGSEAGEEYVNVPGTT